MTTNEWNNLKSFSLFNGMNDTTLQTLWNEVQTRTFKEGEMVFEEGSSGDELYMIRSGALDVLKSVDTSGYIKIFEMTEDSYFGELSFLDSSPRSAAIRAKENTTLYILKKNDLIEKTKNSAVLNELYRNIAIIASERVRNTTTGYVGSLEKQVELLNDKAYFTGFLITVLGAYSIVLVLTNLLNNVWSSVNIYELKFTWIFLLLVALPVLLFVIKNREPWHFFGVTLYNWKRSLIEGVTFSFAFIAIAFALLTLAGNMGWTPKDDTSFMSFLYMMFVRNFPFFVLYFLHSFGQEFVARGVFQNSIQKAFDDEKGWKSVFLASFVFGVSHIPYGSLLVVFTLISGVFFGFIFLRHKNLIGVSIVHSILGAFLFSLSQLPFMSKLG